MRVSLTTEPAKPDRLNEDFVAASPESVVLLDGVGSGGAESGCIHGTPWYVGQLGATLLSRLTTRPGESLTDLLADAIAAVRAEHADTCDVDHPGTPSSTVTLLRHQPDHLDYLALADSVILLDAVDGIQIISDEREHAVSERLRGQIDQIPNGTPEHDQALRDFMTAIAAYRNQPDGFWVAAAKPEAAHESIIGTIDPRQLHRAAVLSDGATRLVDRFGQLDWAQLLELLDRDPSDIIRRTRELEHSDPHGKRWPRGKASDDATIAYIPTIGADDA